MAVIINITLGITRESTVGEPTVQAYTRTAFLDIMEADLDQVFIGSAGQDFAEDQNNVVYTHSTGEVETYPVIFDNPYSSQKIGGDTDFIGVNPQIMLQESKLVRKVKPEDKVVVRGVEYFVKDYQQDGVGLTTIFLRRK